MKVELSANVLAEDLHNTDDLEEKFYVTDASQATDFRWRRNSNISVNIGIHNVHIIPEYEDVDHQSDNLFLEKKDDFYVYERDYRAIRQNYCRCLNTHLSGHHLAHIRKYTNIMI